MAKHVAKLMKGKVVVKTRWQYYVANVVGIFVITGLFIWLLRRAITDEGIDLTSVFFWLALVSIIMVFYALIGFLSSMKTVEVTATGLTISYVFQKHRNEIRFSDVVEIKSRRTEKETRASHGKLRDNFTLVLTDGRVFEFSRSQFDQYGQLKTICVKYVK